MHLGTLLKLSGASAVQFKNWADVGAFGEITRPGHGHRRAYDLRDLERAIALVSLHKAKISRRRAAEIVEARLTRTTLGRFGELTLDWAAISNEARRLLQDECGARDGRASE